MFWNYKHNFSLARASPDDLIHGSLKKAVIYDDSNNNQKIMIRVLEQKP